MSGIVHIPYLPPALVAQGPLRVDEPPEAGSGDAVIGPPLQPVDGRRQPRLLQHHQHHHPGHQHPRLAGGKMAIFYVCLFYKFVKI